MSGRKRRERGRRKRRSNVVGSVKDGRKEEGEVNKWKTEQKK